MVPADKSQRDNICFKLIGEGSTVCVRKNCYQNHRGGQFPVLPGEVYVAKSKDRIFIEPHANINFVDPHLVDEWLTTQKSLSEWSNVLKATQDDHSKEKIASGNLISENDIEGKQTLKSALRNHKTPSKLSSKMMWESNEQAEELQKPIIARQLKTLVDDSDENPSDLLQESFIHIDSKFTALFEIAKVLKSQLDGLDQREHLNALALETKLDDLVTNVGNKPINISEDYDTPNIWSTTSELITKVQKTENLESIVTEHSNRLRKIFDYHQELQMKVQELVGNTQNQLLARINSFETSATKIFQYIQRDINNLKQLQSTLGAMNPTESSPEIKNIKDDLGKLSSQVSALSSEKDEQAIRFNKLGFKSYDEAGAWYAVHVPYDNFGLIVDFHTVMENIYNKTSRLDVIKKLEHIYKIELTDISQATSMSSFESSLPKVFVKDATGEHTATKNNESYFTKVKSFEAYDTPHDGLKARINDLLQIFVSSQMNKINNTLHATDPFYSVALLSLNTSATFITTLLTFMETTYRTYVRSQFSTAKSWHITTRLAKSIIEKVNKPRYGVLESFKAGNAKDIGKQIFYSTLQCLDLMTELIKVKFDNDPIIANELVKFLALNNDNETVKKIEKENIEIKSDVKTAQKDMKEGLKAMQSAGNKTDELKKTVENLSKRIKTLEQQNKKAKRQRRDDSTDTE